MEHLTRPRSILLTALSCLTVLGITSQVRADEDGCRDFEGPFSSVSIPPPTCKSPIGLCTHGILGGEFPADYDFTFQFLVPANDPTDPTKFVYGGNSIITPAKHKGQMFSNDTGVIHITGDPTNNLFVTTAHVASGTGHWKNTTGTFIASGNENFITGSAVGSFTANLCHGEGDDD